MEESGFLRKIATVYTDFPEKFGIPRQSGLVAGLSGRIVLEPQYRMPEAFIGIEEFSHLWILWGFSEEKRTGFKPTVFPPRLGGKIKKGVFATRSPYRPNKIGLSCVKLDEVVSEGATGPELLISGVDMLNGTPVYDIKPYLPYTDAHPEAVGGFGEQHSRDKIEVEFNRELLRKLPQEKREDAIQVLAQDPRAAYQKCPGYIYGMAFAGFDIRFVMEDGKIIVKDVAEIRSQDYRKVKSKTPQ